MIKNLTRRAFLGVAGIAPLSLAACGGSDGSDGAGRADNGIRVMLETNVMSLDTNLAVDGESFEVIADCIDGLTQLDADEVPIPALAERTEVSEDGRTYTFTLRDATWSNGDPVTAADFVFAWRRVCKGGGSYSYMMSDIGQIKGAAAIIAGSESDETTLGVEAKDDRTLVVELEVPVPFFESLMNFPTFYPVNEAFLTSLPDGDYGTSPDTFLSNGAFVLSDYSPGTPSIRLTRNPDYWDADRVALESLSYEVAPPTRPSWPSRRTPSTS